MKKFILTFGFILSFTVVFSQVKTQVLGIWQAKLNGKFMTGKDLGVTVAPYATQSVFYIFNKDNCYFALCASKASLTKANIDNLISKQVAGKGTYEAYDSLSVIPENLIEKFKEQAPFKPKTGFIAASIQGEPMSFYIEPAVKKLFGLNKAAKLELVYLGASW
jgi:hypothetical protein